MVISITSRVCPRFMKKPARRSPCMRRIWPSSTGISSLGCRSSPAALRPSRLTWRWGMAWTSRSRISGCGCCTRQGTPKVPCAFSSDWTALPVTHCFSAVSAGPICRVATCERSSSAFATCSMRCRPGPWFSPGTDHVPRSRRRCCSTRSCRPADVRIASLLPSATEIVCALGLEDSLVAVTHECDYPESVRGKPVVTKSVLPGNGGGADIDRHIRELVHHGSGTYRLDAHRLAALQPDLILTQELCEVCA